MCQRSGTSVSWVFGLMGFIARRRMGVDAA
jgi:hypothetical protein